MNRHGMQWRKWCVHIIYYNASHELLALEISKLNLQKLGSNKTMRCNWDLFSQGVHIEYNYCPNCVQQYLFIFIEENYIPFLSDHFQIFNKNIPSELWAL